MIKEFIFKNPEHFKECHASTIIELGNGDFLAAWFGGSKEGKDDVAIWGAKRRAGVWSKPELLAKVNDLPHWNPVLFRGNGSKIFLYFKVGNNCSHWQTLVMSSADNGENWSIPGELIAGDIGGRGPVKNKCLELSDGTWLAPASNEIGSWQAFVDRSTDRGSTWIRSDFITVNKTVTGLNELGKEAPPGVIQPALWESSPGNVHMLLRSNSGKICRSDSSDGGRAWSPIYETSLPSNNSGIDLAKLADGKLLLAFNPVSKSWGVRWPLTLAVSPDNGESWGKRLDIETVPDREYSYPAVIATSDGGAAITYTWGRESIAFVKLTRRDISGKFNN